MLVIPVALVEDPAVVPLSGPPLAELYVRAGKKYIGGQPEYKELLEVMDLSPLGKVTGSQLRQGGISVTTPLESAARNVGFWCARRSPGWQPTSGDSSGSTTTSTSRFRGPPGTSAPY